MSQCVCTHTQDYLQESSPAMCVPLMCGPPVPPTPALFSGEKLHSPGWPEVALLPPPPECWMVSVCHHKQLKHPVKQNNQEKDEGRK